MITAYINIGSNMGDRHALIERAVALIERLSGPVRRSVYIESEPWGYESDNLFLNLGVAVDTPMAPEELLERLLAIEREINPSSHRRPDGSYVDRAIDIDLIACDVMDGTGARSVVTDTPSLTLPHPRMHLRRFVLVPMAELAPAWRHPLLGLTPREMLARLP
ncbi:MAG: 2-amino-4-hydroxy-6-hydroxymethyldihydropteridine diphosphokinase [Pseudoflavonifractor sp.]|nr:2-amino-4-hydroxy-6-hydroxymethyldihydropteridine diphosphokinase [Pseudoflavonifractor sp.]